MSDHRHNPATKALQLLLLSLLITLVAKHSPPVVLSSHSISLPGCEDRCGNIPIPFPFGIGPKCSHNSWFQITCNTTFNLPIAILDTLIWNFTGYPDTPFELSSIDVGASPVNNNGDRTGILAVYVDGVGPGRRKQGPITPLLNIDMRGSPFVFMGGMRNSLLVSGCGGSAVLRNSGGKIVAGCSTVCSNFSVETSVESSGSGGCYGIGCCQTSLTTSLDYVQLEFLTTVLQGMNSSDEISATVLDTSYVANRTFNVSSLLSEGASIILEWAVPDLPIHSPNYANSLCVLWQDNPKGYSCTCLNEYYRGNPYLPNGCQVVDECQQCPNNCDATLSGNTATYRCPPKNKKSSMLIALGLGISLGSTVFAVLIYGLYQLHKKRNEIIQKQNNFKRNGGLLLQQQMPTSESSIERTKIFTWCDLERATDNFNDNRILGRGGQGTVYKGMLVDGTIVAIKKSKKVDESQLGQFINEVVVLSQVNHRNVVNLFGCCLETEVPLLVYEFAPNGTLFQHIHHPTDDFRVTWKMCVQIAVDSAEAVAYLHSSSYAPIYHRDIKTSNILLDDKYRAKVSDFGTSKTISIDQTHVTTCVQGTFGYIDPEFFQSNQYTDKSDVYSFGVVLVELITSKKPIFKDESADFRGLASEFLSFKQDSRLYDIVDADILEEAKREELEGIAELAKNCLHLNGKQRPTMKEVATTLQMIISKKHVDNLSPSSCALLKGKESLMVTQVGTVK